MHPPIPSAISVRGRTAFKVGGSVRGPPVNPLSSFFPLLHAYYYHSPACFFLLLLHSQPQFCNSGANWQLVGATRGVVTQVCSTPLTGLVLRCAFQEGGRRCRRRASVGVLLAVASLRLARRACAADPAVLEDASLSWPILLQTSTPTSMNG